MGDFFMGSDEEYIKHLNTETKICAWAFNHVDYTNNGEWRLCCNGDAIAKKEQYDTIEKFWSGSEVKEIRKSMIENKLFWMMQRTIMFLFEEKYRDLD
jgi:hypothetical protein